jgi:hypothetical protein
LLKWATYRKCQQIGLSANQIAGIFFQWDPLQCHGYSAAGLRSSGAGIGMCDREGVFKLHALKL